MNNSSKNEKILNNKQLVQAGGGMHTFTEKGYEFEPGLHYVGELAEGTLGRTLFNQVTEGQGWCLSGPL